MRKTLLPVALIAVLALGLLPPAQTQAQSDAQRADAAGAAAEAILELATGRAFNAMYDRIHPDAHAVVPRAVVVGTFADAYAQAQAGNATVTGVRLGQWTWPVTGQVYPDAAEVSYAQEVVEGGQPSTFEGLMYLVETGETWRWFFGDSPEFVQERIERYVGGAVLQSPAERPTGVEFLEFVADDLDQFYRDSLEPTEFGYQSPSVTAVTDEVVPTACGGAAPGFWAFYCPPDQGIYLDYGLLLDLAEEADFAAAFVVAHEWAHHIQTGIGIERTGDPAPNQHLELYSIELELMADCLSGVWMLDADTRGLLEAGDVEETAEFIVARLADPPGFDEYDERAHGTAEQRRAAFLVGYRDGYEGCGEVLS